MRVLRGRGRGGRGVRGDYQVVIQVGILFFFLDWCRLGLFLVGRFWGWELLDGEGHGMKTELGCEKMLYHCIDAAGN